MPIVGNINKLAQHNAIEITQQNPKRAGSGANARYELYKFATTVGEALELGAWAGDIANDHNHGYIRCTESTSCAQCINRRAPLAIADAPDAADAQPLLGLAAPEITSKSKRRKPVAEPGGEPSASASAPAPAAEDSPDASDAADAQPLLGYLWLHVCGFWVHVHQTFGCMYVETFGCKVCGCWVQYS